MRRSLLIAIAILATIPLAAQEWERSEYHDDLNNQSGILFTLYANDGNDSGRISVICSGGKMQAALLFTREVIDASAGTVELQYRRDDEPKPYTLNLQVAKDLHTLWLSIHGAEGLRFYNLLYGSKKLVVGIPVFLGPNAVMTFTVPSPSVVFAECAIR